MLKNSFSIMMNTSKIHQDEKYIDLIVQEPIMILKLLGNKVVSVSKLLSDILKAAKAKRLEEDQVIDNQTCPGCGAKFFTFFKKKYTCEECSRNFCQQYSFIKNRCLKYYLKVECESLTPKMFEKVVHILEPPKTPKKKTIIFNICLDCFQDNYLEIDQLLNSQESRTENKENKAGLTLEEKQDKLLQQYGITTPNLKPHKKAFKKMNTNATNSLLNPTEQFSSVVLSPGKFQSSQDKKVLNLKKIPAVQIFIQELEKMNLSSSLREGIVQNVVSFEPSFWSSYFV